MTPRYLSLLSIPVSNSGDMSDVLINMQPTREVVVTCTHLARVRRGSWDMH
jgi:hypothetical protein